MQNRSKRLTIVFFKNVSSDRKKMHPSHCKNKNEDFQLNTNRVFSTLYHTCLGDPRDPQCIW